jgi:ABC-type glutathione transport system ATPase component
MAEQNKDVVLRVAGISKRFGGLQALSDVGITIERGQVYGLIGPNGAGKTTFFNVITGLYTPDSGTFELAGKPYEPTAVHEVAKAGIARTFQNIRLFAEMTALENVMVGRHIRTKSGLLGAVLRTKGFKAEEAAIAKRAQELLDYVGIGKFADYKARTLSLWRPAPPGDCPGAGHRPPADRAGRARRRHERHREGAAARADRPHSQRQPHHLADRARREAGDGPVRPRDGARLRQADRRRHARHRAEERKSD